MASDECQNGAGATVDVAASVQIQELLLSVELCVIAITRARESTVCKITVWDDIHLAMQMGARRLKTGGNERGFSKVIWFGGSKGSGTPKKWIVSGVMCAD
jgi:hypothetical protein